MSYKKNILSDIFVKARHDRSIALLDDLEIRSVLDVGCEDGHFIKLLRERFPEASLYGCDIDDEALMFAGKACPNARFLHGNFLSLDLPGTHLVAMLEVIEHSEDPHEMLERAVKLIGKEGYLLLSLPRPEALQWRIIWKIWSNTFGRRWKGTHTRLTEEELVRLAEKAGLRVERKTRFFFDCISIMLFRTGR